MMELKCSSCDVTITEKVAKYSVDKYSKELCYTCQEKEKAKQGPKEEKVVSIATSSDKDYVLISEKKHILYKALLRKAHEKGLLTLMVLQHYVDFERSSAWCIVRAMFKAKEGETSKTFDGFGSSTQENTGKMTQKHFVEMAHTRAKARSLRDALGIGDAAAEEINS